MMVFFIGVCFMFIINDVKYLTNIQEPVWFRKLQLIIVPLSNS